MNKLLICCFLTVCGCASLDQDVAQPAENPFPCGSGFISEYENLNSHSHKGWTLNELPYFVESGGVPPRFSETWSASYRHCGFSETRVALQPLMTPIPDDADFVDISGEVSYENLPGGDGLRYLRLSAVGDSAVSLIQNIKKLEKFKNLRGLIICVIPPKFMHIDMTFALNLPSLRGLEINATDCVLDNFDKLREHDSLRAIRVISGAEIEARDCNFDEGSKFATIQSFGDKSWTNITKLDLSGAFLVDKSSLKQLKNVKTMALPLFCGAHLLPESVETIILSHSGIWDAESVIRLPNIKRIDFSLTGQERYYIFTDEIRKKYKFTEERGCGEMIWRIEDGGKKERIFHVF